MASSNYELTSFFKEIETLLRKRITGDPEKSNFQEIEPMRGECFFIVDLTQGKIVHFGGMKKMFGYTKTNIDLPFVFEKSHPEDIILVQKIVKNIVSQIVHLEIPVFTNIFSVASRFRKNNGQYIRVLTDNFIIQTNKENLVQSILIRYTDLSFLDDSIAVDWKVNATYLNKISISNEIYGEKKNIFTKREKEIILLIFIGSSNLEIARSLNISRHTVATHRRNIFSKSKCSSREEIKIFCKKNGVFHGNNF
jgi:DNA-binding CsgD family transcriptional regulator